MFKKTLIAAAMFAVAGIGSTASATVATGNFTVSLVISKTCSVTTSSASNITLGTAVTGGTSASSSGTFTVNCSNTTPFFVGLQPASTAGSNNTGSGTLKGTGSNSNTIAYQLYQNSGLTTVWGNTATATSAGNGVSGTGAGMTAAKAITETVYANATGSTDVTPDTYSDTVAINVNF